jgi:hypothetical protein
MQPAVNHEKGGAPPSGNLTKKLECWYLFCCSLVGIAIDYCLMEGFTALSRRAECPNELRNPIDKVGFEHQKITVITWELSHSSSDGWVVDVTDDKCVWIG